MERPKEGEFLIPWFTDKYPNYIAPSFVDTMRAYLEALPREQRDVTSILFGPEANVPDVIAIFEEGTQLGQSLAITVLSFTWMGMSQEERESARQNPDLILEITAARYRRNDASKGAGI